MRLRSEYGCTLIAVALSRINEEDEMTFIQQFGRTLGTKQVTVTPGGKKPGREVSVFEALIQSKTVDFNVDTPVYEGDQLEWDDPRGGRQRVYAAKVKVFDAGSSSMRHISIEHSEEPPAPKRPIPGIAGGHVIVINGNNVNVAVEGSTITQQVPVAAGFEALADAVGRALALIEQTQGVDGDEVEAAREAATLVVEESSKEKPSESVIKKLLPTIRGVLNSAAAAGAGAAATGLVGQLFV